MPNITVKIGGPESLRPQISKATPMGALPTEAMVWVGQLLLTGSAGTMRALADACTEAPRTRRLVVAVPRVGAGCGWPRSGCPRLDRKWSSR
jgi:hypothetical protein